MKVNRKVGNVWVVVAISFMMVVILMWYTYAVVDGIEKDSFYISSAQLPEFDQE